MVRVIHKKCGKIAFYFKKKLEFDGEIIEASNIILKDGNYPNPGDKMICGSCNESLDGSELIQENWTDWFIVEKFHTFENERIENGSVPEESKNPC